MSTTILLADDRRIFREALRCLVQQRPDVEHVAEAGNGHDALKLAEALLPAIAVINARLPGIDGVAVARRIAAEHWAGRIVGMADSADLAEAMAGAGAALVLREYDSLATLTGAIFGDRMQVPESEGRKAAEAPSDSEDRYRAIVEDQTELISRFTLDGTITFANTACCRYFGRSRDEMVGHSLWPLIPESEHQRLIDHVASLSPSEPWGIIEHSVRLPDGRIRWQQWVNRAIFGPDGRIAEIQGTGRDVTERRQAEEALRKAHEDLEHRMQERNAELLEANASLERQIAERHRAEEALRKSEEKYRSIFEIAPYVIGSVTSAGIIADCNQKVRDVFGLEPHEVIGQPISRFLAPECRQKAWLAVQQVLNGATSLNNEYTAYRKDGSLVEISINSSPLKDESRGTLLISVIADITDRKQAEEALRKSEERYRELVELLPASITICDLKGTFLQVNSEFERASGWTRGEALGKTAAGLGICSLEFIEVIRNNLLPRLFAEGTVFNVETEMTTRNGNRFPASQNWILIRDAEGNPKTILIVTTDITYRKEIEHKLIGYQAQLRSLASELSLAEERERRQIAVSLHDGISQSLAVAKLKLGELQRLAVTPEVRQRAAAVLQFIEQAIRDTRQLTAELSPPVLYELGLEAALEWLTEQFQERHGIVCEFEDDKQPKLMDDDIRVVLFQSVRELLMNAAKHAQARGVKVSVRCEGPIVLATVEDDGVGFDISSIGDHHGQNGGFGLFSIRERLGHLGGNVRIESSPGKGTRITLAAPLKDQQKNGKRS